MVSNNQSDSCGLFAKPQVGPHEVNPRKCGKGVGELFTPATQTSYKQRYPHLSTTYPHLGGIGLGRTFQYLVVLKPLLL
jgi:hypothetical protein